MVRSTRTAWAGISSLFGNSTGNRGAAGAGDAATRAVEPVPPPPAEVAAARAKAQGDRRRLHELEAHQTVMERTMALAEYSADGAVKKSNEIFARLLGFSVPETLLLSYRDLLAATDQAGWARLQRGESLSGQYERRGKNGRTVWTQSTFGPIHDGDGRLVSIVEISVDVTQQLATLRQLESAMQEIQRVAKLSVGGDLVTRIPIEGMSGDITALCGDVNSVLNARDVLVGRVKLLTVDVRSAAEEISRGNTTLSQQTESQAASLEQTASSMREMTTSVKVTADNAAKASDFAQAAHKKAESGIQVVNSVVSAMAQINASSKKVADIISVIDEIAFQTNLLALNAAVEAARAGENGRGFAVVASEVRSLAGRSATAAKEIKGLIKDSVKRVNDGSVLADESGKALGEIMAAVRKVTDVISMIAASSLEQSTGIEQVNKSVMQIDEATQQNAALVEQTAAASQAIVDQVGELHTTVQRYKTHTDQPAAAPLRRHGT